jgi:hypothetical protein
MCTKGDERVSVRLTRVGAWRGDARCEKREEGHSILYIHSMDAQPQWIHTAQPPDKKRAAQRMKGQRCALASSFGS